MNIKRKLLNAFALLTLILLLISCSTSYFNWDLDEIKWKELSKSLEITNTILKENKEIYEEAVDNFLYFKDENWNHQYGLSNLFNFIKENNGFTYLEQWSLLKELWFINEKDSDFAKNIFGTNNKEREILKTCLIENEYFTTNQKVKMNDFNNFENISNQLIFIEFVNSLEEIKDDISDRTYKNLTKARDLIEENLKKFKEEWCKEEYIDYINKYLIKSSHNEQEEQQVYLEDISKEINMHEKSIIEEYKKEKKEEFEAILNEIRKEN